MLITLHNTHYSTGLLPDFERFVYVFVFCFVFFCCCFLEGGVVGRGCDGYWSHTDLTVYSLLSLFPTVSGSPAQPDTRP